MTRTICAWCPTFDPTVPTPGVSHGICPSCAAQLEAEAAPPVSTVERTIEETRRQALAIARRGQTLRAALALVMLLLVAPAVQAQDRPLSSSIGPSVALIAGSTLDLVSTLQALKTVPGAVEANPLLSHGGTAGLVVTKVALTAALVWSITHLTHQGHSRVASVIGYAGGIVLSGIAVHNARVGQ